MGPAIISMPTWPTTWRLASATQRLPGPTILSTRGTVAVPYASAAIACAPPIRKIRVTPGERAGGEHRVGHAAAGGTTATISWTPATRAGTAFMTTERRVRRLAARDVEPDPVERRHLHAEQAAVGLASDGTRGSRWCSW